MHGTLRALIRDESGATMVEYGIMVVLIAAVSIGIVTTLGQHTLGLFTNLNSKF